MSCSFLILGTGILGSELHKVLSTDNCNFRILSKKCLDITQQFSTIKAKLTKEISKLKYKPYVINAAAFTDVNLAEKDRPAATEVNAFGPFKLAHTCRILGVPLIHISTDFVFNGQSQHPYSEYDKTNPINFYGKSKLLGEHFIKDSGCSYMIVRTGWLYNNHKGLIPRLLKIVKKKLNVELVQDQIYAPTHARSLARQIFVMAKYDLRGMFHATSSGSTSPLELYSYLYTCMHEQYPITRTTTRSKFFQGEAQRPYMSLLNNFKLKRLDLDVMPHWKIPINQMLKDLKLVKTPIDERETEEILN